MTPRQKAQEIVEKFNDEIHARAMLGATESITPRDVLIDVIEQALLEAAKVEWPSEQECRQKIHELMEMESKLDCMMFLSRWFHSFRKSRLKNVEE